MAIIDLDDYDFTDLPNYPNIGYNKDDELIKLSFNGNPLLRPLNSKILLSPEAEKEIIKCKYDRDYFIENYVQIITDDGLLKPQLRDYQLETMETYDNHKYVLNLSARRSGKTVTASMYLLHKLVFWDEYKIGIVANKAKLMSKTISDIKSMYEMLSPFLQHGVKVWNKQSIELSNGSFIIGDIMGDSSMRGFTLDALYVDEFSWAKESNIQGFMDSVFPIISANKHNQLIITTTPNGEDAFHKLWRDSELKLNDFARIKITWDRIPGRDRDWYEDEVKRMGSKYCLQNHDVAFLGTGDKTLLKPDTLTNLVKKIPINNDYLHDGVKLYKEYNPDNVYLVTTDTSKTLGNTTEIDNDYICVKVLEFTPTKIEEVLTYRTNEIHYKEIAQIVYDIGESFDFPLCVIENNEGSGTFTANHLQDVLEYPNMYFDPNKDGMEVGIRTTSKNRPVGLTTLEKLISRDILQINDADTIREFFTFIKIGKKYQAQLGSTDDCIMSLVVGIFVLLDENNDLEITIDDYLDGNVLLQSKNDDQDLDFIGKIGKEDEDTSWLHN
jgi:hypothetical protein